MNWEIEKNFPRLQQSGLIRIRHVRGLTERPQHVSNGSSRTGFQSLSTFAILGQIIVCCGKLSCALQDVQQHPWLFPPRC